MVKELFKKKDFLVKNAMIIGGGRIGRRAALNLENIMQLKLVEENKEKLKNIYNQDLNSLNNIVGKIPNFYKN